MSSCVASTVAESQPAGQTGEAPRQAAVEDEGEVPELVPVVLQTKSFVVCPGKTFFRDEGGEKGQVAGCRRVGSRDQPVHRQKSMPRVNVETCR